MTDKEKVRRVIERARAIAGSEAELARRASTSQQRINGAYNRGSVSKALAVDLERAVAFAISSHEFIYGEPERRAA